MQYDLSVVINNSCCPLHSKVVSSFQYWWRMTRKIQNRDKHEGACYDEKNIISSFDANFFDNWVRNICLI